MIKFNLKYFVFGYILLLLLSCGTLPEKTGEAKAVKTSFSENFPQPEKMQETMARIYKANGAEILVQIARYESRQRALGNYLQVFEAQSNPENWQTYSLKKIRRISLSPDRTILFGWHDDKIISMRSTIPLTRDQWKIFAEELTASWQRGDAYPSLFLLTFREESSPFSAEYTDSACCPYSIAWKTSDGISLRLSFGYSATYEKVLSDFNNLMKQPGAEWTVFTGEQNSFDAALLSDKSCIATQTSVLCLSTASGENPEPATSRAQFIEIRKAIGME